jgi:hypothetical protein
MTNHFEIQIAPLARDKGETKAFKKKNIHGYDTIIHFD